MRAAVLSLCRDRLEYTKRSFSALQKAAGCDYDHYVLDQGSTDGTWEWLKKQQPRFVYGVYENMGIARGMNFLLDYVSRVEPAGYDVIVKLDNDCELVQPNTLRDVCELVMESGDILSPRICGLNNPPASTGEYMIGGETILDIPQIGGIFLAAPAGLYEQYRFPEDLPPWGMDDAHICAYVRNHGGRCGYVKRLEAWHMDTTSGQHARYPEYFARTLDEGKVAL